MEEGSSSGKNVAGEELTQTNVKAIAKIEGKAKAKAPLSDRIAAAIANVSGSMLFAMLNSVWFIVWILYNTLASDPFDPYPFTFLTLMVSLEAILLSIFIMINQNRETVLAERRNQLDLQVNLLAEQENTRMLHFLEAIAEKVGCDIDTDEFREEMKKDIDPERIMDEIENENGDTA